ncbi:response regulator transcription factor [Roseomonas sp. NAR14]|uniref:Response regulator transcription factor n=1 Tax=Roseomonas acroporae TaxID=2937791 RepID=A0A9X1Y8G2_9PROT|nr:response regulator transcription factor [Roseomonas acroporae]MCK8785168.1 response regulator transcription factor [Roseomonas acroporae]
MAASELLLVEDDAFQRQAVGDYLTLQGLSVTSVADGAAFRRAVESRMPDLALVDVRLPGEDGFTLARWLRARSEQVGIIMLTAADELVDRVVGLESGADDYVVKPFEPRELLARVRALLRRGQRAAAPAAPAAEARPLIQVGAAMLDLERRILVGPAGEERLTAGEYDLLRLLVENPNRPLHRDWLLEATARAGEEPEAFDRAIDLRIMRLRRKVERDPAHPEAIRTVRGVGYVFVPASG